MNLPERIISFSPLKITRSKTGILLKLLLQGGGEGWLGAEGAGGLVEVLVMLERSRTSSPVQASAPRITGTSWGCAPTTSSEGSRLDPSSCMDPASLPWDWYPAHRLLLLLFHNSLCER